MCWNNVPILLHVLFLQECNTCVIYRTQTTRGTLTLFTLCPETYACVNNTGVCYSVCSITHERVVLISLLSACCFDLTAKSTLRTTHALDSMCIPMSHLGTFDYHVVCNGFFILSMCGHWPLVGTDYHPSSQFSLCLFTCRVHCLLRLALWYFVPWVSVVVLFAFFTSVFNYHLQHLLATVSLSWWQWSICAVCGQWNSAVC